MGLQSPNRARKGVLDERKVLLLDKAEVGVLLLLHWGLYSLRTESDRMVYATTPQTLISSHSKIKSSMVWSSTFPTGFYWTNVTTLGGARAGLFTFSPRVPVTTPTLTGSGPLVLQISRTKQIEFPLKLDYIQA